MDILKLQQEIDAFIKDKGCNNQIEVRLLDLVSEIGELSKELLTGSAYGCRPFEVTGNWTGELGDAFFSLICVANATGCSLETCLKTVLMKYEDRYTINHDLSSGKKI